MRLSRQAKLLAIALLTVAAPHGAAQTTLRFQFKEKERLFYSVEQKTKITFSLMGQTFAQNNSTVITMYLEVVKIDSQQHAQVRVKATHSRMSADGLLGAVNLDSKDKDAPNDLAGRTMAQVNKIFANMEFTATMLPTGELTDLKVSETTAAAIKALPSADLFGDIASADNFKDLLSGLVLPAGPIAKGKTWTQKSVTQTPEGKLTTDNVFTLDDTVTQDGQRLEKISLKPTIKVEANAKGLLKVKSIEGSGKFLFDNHVGRVVESVMQQTKQGKLDVLGFSLDSTTEVTTTVRLKKAADTGKEIESVKIDESEYVEKTVATEPLETLAGVARSFTPERSYEPAIVLPKDAPASDSLKAKVEAALGITLGKRVTVKESVALDGKAITKLDVQWVERYRRGTATASDGSTFPFQVRVGLRIKLAKAK